MVLLLPIGGDIPMAAVRAGGVRTLCSGALYPARKPTLLAMKVFMSLMPHITSDNNALSPTGSELLLAHAASGTIYPALLGQC